MKGGYIMSASMKKMLAGGFAAVLWVGLFVILSFTPAQAADYIYWTNYGNGTIGRANLNGTSPNQSFITGGSDPTGVVVDSNYIYWTNYGNGTIGRANLDGTSPNQSWITGCSNPIGIAINGSYVYWANNDTNTIGRANLDGTSPNQSWITGVSNPFGIAIDSSYVYWPNYGTNTIGRANLDGTSPNQSWITGCSGPAGIAVDGSYVYWANNVGGTIGRANLDGSSPNQSWISGASSPYGVTAGADYIYWTNYGNGTIGRANLDGTSPNQSWISGCSSPVGVHVRAGATVINLVSFTAEQAGDSVRLDWETGSEIDTAGFHLWRAKADEPYARITSSLIPSEGGPFQGAQYTYLDKNVVWGETYFYGLEDIDLSGASAFHGPISVKVEGLSITLQSPGNDTYFRRTPPLTFQWADNGLSFFRLQFSSSPDFGRGTITLPIAKKGGSSWVSGNTYTPTSSEWDKVYQLGRNKKAIYWRVYSTDGGGNPIVSGTFRLLMK
jgi:hypothetical protein